MDRKLFLGLIGLATAASFAAHIYRDNAPKYTPRQSVQPASEYQGAFEWLTSIRKNLITGQIEPSDYFNMKKAVSAYVRNQPKSTGYHWIEMGPDNVGGRVRAITVDPNNHQKIWAGGVSGGLWKSLDGGNTWQNVQAFGVNLCVSDIAILGNGHLYVATGSQFETPSGQGGSGFIGAGIFMSSDDGQNFSHPLAPTAPWTQVSPWVTCTRIKADPTNANRLWIASSNPGTRLYDESTNSVSTPTFPSIGIGGQASTDIDVSADGQTVLVSIATKAYLSTDAGQNFTQLTIANNFPTSNIGRLEMAISPDDGNYMYALVTTGSGTMRGVWSSTDRGAHWFQVWPGGIPSIDIFSRPSGSQGFYDCAIGVRPGHPDEIWVGGLQLWKYTLNGAPEQIAAENGPPGCFYCVHSDVHEITFADANIAYVGCDGGVYRTSSGGNSWTAYNRNLNITQFYSVAYNAVGHVLGGAQDNGSQLVPGYGISEQEAVSVNGGDGFDADMSQLDTNILFSTVYFGSLSRSNDGGNNSGQFYDAGVLAEAPPTCLLGDCLGDFYTNFRLHEDGNDTNSIDSVKKVFKLVNFNDSIRPGESRSVGYHGGISSVVQYGTFANTTSATIHGPFTSDTLKFQDHVTSRLAVGFGGTQGVWVTRDADNFNVNPRWAKVCNVNGNVNCIEWSANGDALFYGTSEGRIYRVMGFNNARTIAQMSIDSADYELNGSTMGNLMPPVQMYSGGAIVTGLGPSQNSNVLVATFGNYLGNGKIRRCNNALQDSPLFTDNLWTSVPPAIQGMPLYDCMIDQYNEHVILVGSEFGVWATDNDGTNWTNQTQNDNGIPGVPVFAIRQQTMNYQNNPIGPDWIKNNGMIYVGTHGRGFFRTDALLGIKPIAGHPGGDALGGLTIAPNPTSTQSIISFHLAQAGDVTLNVYTLDGRMVRTISRKNLAPLEQHIPLDVEDFNTGTYIMDVMSNGTHHAARMVVAR